MKERLSPDDLMTELAIVALVGADENGYRLLEEGEIVSEGDEYETQQGRWRKSDNHRCGVQGKGMRYRRRIVNEAVINDYVTEKAIEALTREGFIGDGWRELSPIERIEQGDEVFLNGRWVESTNFRLWNSLQSPGLRYRRRV